MSDADRLKSTSRLSRPVRPDRVRSTSTGLPGRSVVRPEIRVFADADELGRTLATRIADGIAATPPGGHYVLGCPGGRSPRTTYGALAAEVARRRLDLRRLIVAMMDEYVDDDGANADADAPHGCVRLGGVEIVQPLNAAAGPGRGVTPDRLWVPDAADPAAYEDRLADAGGIDLFLL